MTVSETVTREVGLVQIVLSKHSEVPLREQIAEQIVYLIRTGQLRRGRPCQASALSGDGLAYTTTP